MKQPSMEEVSLGLAKPPSCEQTALVAARKIANVGAAARSSFVDRDEAIGVLEIGAACGEHVCVLGPPGTGKSAMTRFFADGLGTRFFRKLLNPDTTRDELVGPIDPTALGLGRWDRCWSGMADAEFCFLDEIGKASSQVINMILDAMEERLVTSGTGDRGIPLHTLVGASNETLGEDLAAAWDRFTLRLVVHRLGESGLVARLLTRSRGERPLSGMRAPRFNSTTALDQDDLIALREQTHFMAENISDDVVETVVKLWSKIGNVTKEPVSDRRWERLPVAAAGRALLMGRPVVEPDDLIVAQHILWTDINDVSSIAEFVRNTVDAEAAELAVKDRMVSELEQLQAQPADPNNVAEMVDRKARVNLRSSKLMREIPGGKTSRRREWSELRERLLRLQEWALTD